jgi:formate dehydrogenase subunit gamma
MKRTDKIRRFTTTERLLHWSFALPQIVLMITGGWLLAFSSQSGQSVVKVNVVMIHKVAAACFLIAPFLVFMSGDAKTLIKNIRLALNWNSSDLQWFFRSFMKVIVPSTSLPEVGKFNAGQKLNMLIVMILGILFAVSGLLMWFLDDVLLAWIVHAVAFLVVLLLVSGHVYMSILHPSTRPSFWSIINGNVDREWANHHHPQWAKELDPTNTDEVSNL